MKNNIIVFFMLLSMISFGQNRSAIGTTSTDASAAFEVKSASGGFLTPRMSNAERNAIVLPATGLIVFNTTTNCLEINIGTKDNPVLNCFTAEPNKAAVAEVICPGGTPAVKLVQNIYTPIGSAVESANIYNGGNGGVYEEVTAYSNGLIAYLPAGTLAKGNGILSFKIFGTPINSGITTFIIPNLLDKGTCEVKVDVTPAAAITGNISSINCTGLDNGVLTGSVVASGVSSVISYEGGNGGVHVGQSVSSTGVTGLTATLTGGSFAAGSGILTYTITGTPANSGTANFAINIGGQTCTLKRTVVAPTGALTALSCSSAMHTGTLTGGIAASNVSSKISYQGNGGVYSGQSVNSTDVYGLTATVLGGTFANGSGELTYVITGTPVGSGDAKFSISVGGQNCVLVRTVALPIGGLSTLTCSGTLNGGTLTDGVVASGISSIVSYTGGNGGTYSAQSVDSQGVLGLKATIGAGAFASGSGVLTYAISGTPSGGGTATFKIEIGGQTCFLTLEVKSIVGTISGLTCISGVLDKGLAQNRVVPAGVTIENGYTGGNGGSYSGQTIASSNVGGLFATLAPGKLASGTGKLVFTITGTPDIVGEAKFTVNIDGKQCAFTIKVGYSCDGKSPGLYPDLTDARYFYKCDGEGVSTRYRCNEGLYYDPVKKMCSSVKPF